MDWNCYAIHSLIESAHLQEQLIYESRKLNRQTSTGIKRSPSKSLAAIGSLLIDEHNIWNKFRNDRGLDAGIGKGRLVECNNDNDNNNNNKNNNNQRQHALVYKCGSSNKLIVSNGRRNIINHKSDMKNLTSDQKSPQISGHGTPSKMRQLLDTFRPRCQSETSSTYTRRPRSAQGRNRNASGKLTNGHGERDDSPSPCSSVSTSTTPPEPVTPPSVTAAIGPAEFLEMYRSRAYSEPRPEARFEALANIRRRLNSNTLSGTTVPSIYKNALKRQQMVLWRDKEKGTRLLVLPSNNGNLSGCVESANTTDKSSEQIYSRLFQSTTCYEILPKSNKSVVFDSELSVKKALFALLENNARFALIWDSNQHALSGMLTVTDFINVLQKYDQSTSDDLTSLEDSKISTFKVLFDASTSRLVSVSPEDSLSTAVLRLRHYNVHRLPVIDPVGGNVISTMTYKRILRFLYAAMNDLAIPSFMTDTVEHLHIGTFDDVSTIHLDTPVVETLQMFTSKRISSVPVVDEERKLIAVYSRADVINMAVNKTYTNLNIQVGELLSSHVQGEEVHSCSKSDTLLSVITKLVNANTHRLVAIDESGRVEGIISLSDIFEYLFSTTVNGR